MGTSKQNYKSKVRNTKTKQKLLNSNFTVSKSILDPNFKMYMMVRPNYCYRSRRARNLDLMSLFEEPVVKRPRRCDRIELARPELNRCTSLMNFEDLMPIRSFPMCNPFKEMSQMLTSKLELDQSWDQPFDEPLIKIQQPENLKIKIDSEKNLVSIQYQDENSVYQSTQSLPQYILDGNMHRQIKCQVLDGQIKMILPEKPENKKAMEAEQSKMIEVAPEILSSEAKGGNKKDDTRTEEIEKSGDQPEMLEVEIVNE